MANNKLYEIDEKGFIEFGRYPKTVVSDTKLINQLKMINEVNHLGYTECDGFEYKKVTSKPYKDDYKFNNGTKIIKGKDYYFKVEPIKWKVIENDNGRYKLFTKDIIDNACFYPDIRGRNINEEYIEPSNYMYSNIRAYLNGYDGLSYDVDNYTGKGFIDIAFNDEEKEMIQTTLVDNSVDSVSNNLSSYTCDNTLDKVYLLSYQDLMKEKYFFGKEMDSDPNRKAKMTDYVRCNGGEASTIFEYNGSYWTRSNSAFYSFDASYVHFMGFLVDACKVSSKSMGVRPIIEISKK